jgi:hypothetical protein
MKFLIIVAIFILSLMPVQAQTRVYIEGCLNYSGEYTPPEIMMTDKTTKQEYNAVPDLTLSDLIVNIGGFKKNSDIQNIIIVSGDSSEYIDFNDKYKQKMILKDGDRIIVKEVDEQTITEKHYLDFVKNNYYQNTVLICFNEYKENEIMPYTGNLHDIITQLAENNDFKKYKILIKRSDGCRSKKIRIKTINEFNILPNDIICINVSR